MRTSILSVAIFCLSAGSIAMAEAFDNNMGWGSQMTRAQLAAQKRENARLAFEQKRQAAEMVRQQRRAEAEQRRAQAVAEAQQRAAARQQQIELARQQKEAARQAKLAARNGGYYNSGFPTAYGNQYESGGWSGYGGGSSLNGHRCSPRDTDETVCRACAIYGEDRGSMGGMTAVNTVIDNRIRSGRYGSTACQVVYAPGQFVGAHHTMVDRHGILSQVEQATRATNAEILRKGAMGFRSYCGRGRHRTSATGGNCFGSANAEDSIPTIEIDPTMTAEDIDNQAKQNLLDYAELYNEDNAG